ncbi:MAG: hypothetical protein KDC27_06955 [Acidobacteria bacterium]|nr:hypothetical protein [Acidobacteriota bacterium]
MSKTHSIDGATVGTVSESTAGRLQSFLLPSLSDWVFAAMLAWLFFGAAGAQSLLADGDAGWHIRLGEMLIANRALPATDPFSFTMAGRVWFAWEWLSDLILGAVHMVGGLPGVVLLAGVVIAATMAMMLRYMLWLGVNFFLAVGATMMIGGVSTMHWLARPHMFTWGLLLATLWLLEADRRKPSKRVWLLIPITAVWVNLHGGFVAGVVTVGAFGAGVALEQLWAARQADGKWSWFIPPAARRYGLLLAGCAAATLLNPWGWHLHAHILAYLQSDFILKYVQEFQSPNFSKGFMKPLEATILLTLMLCGRMVWRGEFVWPLLTLAWAHAALTSVRHAPLFMIVAAPVLALELTRFLDEGARQGNSLLQTLKEIADDYSGKKASTASEVGLPLLSWLTIAAVVALGVTLDRRQGEEHWRAEFPAVRFPKLACDALAERLTQGRVLTTDQWGDYLIYRLHPEYHAFIDGRSDFYDPQVRDDYLALMGAKWNWASLLARYEFDAVLAPLDWPLGNLLKTDANWELVYDDGQALYFERRRPSSEPAAGARYEEPPRANLLGRLR